MRKMFSKNQIKEIISQAIDSGTIPAMLFPSIKDVQFEYNGDDNYYIFSLKLDKRFTLAHCHFDLDNAFGCEVFFDFQTQEYLSNEQTYDYGEYETDGDDILYHFYFNAEQPTGTEKLVAVRRVLIYIGEI